MAKSLSFCLLGLLIWLAACHGAAPDGVASMPFGDYLISTARAVFQPAPEPGVTFELSMRGRLWIENDADGLIACNTAELVFRPRGRELPFVDLWPGFRQLGVEPMSGFDEWPLGLERIDSDRPMNVSLGPWHTRLTPAVPVRPGESWRVEMVFCDPVETLSPGMQLDEIVELAGFSPERFRAMAGAEMVALFESLVARFTATAASSSFAKDGFYVLLPIWPAPYSCPSPNAFHPLACVARRNLPGAIEVEVPEGWRAVLPSPAQTSPDGKTVLAQAPHLLILAERMAERVIDVPALDGASRTVTLCAPDGYRDSLTELERRVREALPALERRLGPEPEGEPAVCLSPLPVELGGLSAGRLALVTISSFAQHRAGDLSEEAAARLRRWVETDPFFVSDRQSTTIHELAHHWWRVELPEVWDRLLSEGAAMYVAREIQRELDPSQDVLFYAERDPWMGCAQMEFVGETPPTLEQYLRLDGWADLPSGGLAPYLLGLRLMERVFGRDDAADHWRALSRLHAWPAAAYFSPETIFLVDPFHGALFLEAAREAAPVACRDRVDLVVYARRMGQGFIRTVLDPKALPGDLAPDRLLGGLSDDLLKSFLQNYLDHGSDDVALDEMVLGIAEVPSCDPDDEPCRTEEDRSRRRVLGAWMALDSGSPPNEDASAPAEAPAARDLVEQARALIQKPVSVDEAELAGAAGRAPAGGDGDKGEMRVEILVRRLISRWAANAILVLDRAGRLDPSGVVRDGLLGPLEPKDAARALRAIEPAPDAP
jgi:hypothetical protein